MSEAPPAGEPVPELPPRYEDRCSLGRGGFGEVRRVFDRSLQRTVALKLLRPDLDPTGLTRTRFLTEIRIAANLHHPGVLALHDWGELADGRLWFTMPEVHGGTLAERIAARFPAGVDELVELFARVCEAMAYAHECGVIHRDLKPDNVLLSERGHVMIVDWGLARRFRSDPAEHADAMPQSPRPAAPGAPGATRAGQVLGTPAYMAPEQARGQVARHGPATDVYALGAILYHILAGAPPYARRGPGAWRRVVFRAPAPVESVAPAEVALAPELAAICGQAMAREPAGRYADAGALNAALQAWLTAARRRKQALAELERVEAAAPELEAERRREQALRLRARRLLDEVPAHGPVADKLPGWALEEEAELCQRELALAEARWLQGVHGVLSIDPELPEAHATLADHYCRVLLDAERGRRPAEAARAEVLLGVHDRGRHAAVLQGLGALTLYTDPPGAVATLFRYEREQRRLVARPVRELGPTPLVELPLEQGSYLVRLLAPGRTPVTYPVLVERGGHWDARPPGANESEPVHLPSEDALHPDEVYVPAGWAIAGGDPSAPDVLPETRAWVAGFAIGRTAVTQAEYLAFLADLVRQGQEERALAACPRANRGMQSAAADGLAYRRGADGRFQAPDPARAGPGWEADCPAVLMTWNAARAYCAWLSARRGLPYRLPNELEREKAVRGADGRRFPWGDHGEPTWTCMLPSFAGQPRREPVGTRPVDESPYGLRDGAGNTRDWCANLWTHEGPEVCDGRLLLTPAADDDPGYRSVRGGAWTAMPDHCRAAARFVLRPEQWRSTTGLRVVRSLP